VTALPLVFAGFALLAEPPADLMKRLAEQDSRLDKVEKEGSYTMTDVSEELASDRSVDHSDKSVTRVSFREGKQERTLVRAEADGQDRTEQARRKPKKEKEEGQDVSFSVSSPFGAKEQPRYSFALAGPDSSDRIRRC